MADISRSLTEMEVNDKELQKSWLQIQISEKKNQLLQLAAALNKLKTVDMKKIEHQVKILEKEISLLGERLNIDGKVIDV